MVLPNNLLDSKLGFVSVSKHLESDNALDFSRSKLNESKLCLYVYLCRLLLWTQLSTKQDVNGPSDGTLSLNSLPRTVVKLEAQKSARVRSKVSTMNYMMGGLNTLRRPSIDALMGRTPQRI